MFRLYQTPIADRRTMEFGDNALDIADRWMVRQLAFYYRRLRRGGVDDYLARNTVWMAAWIGSLPGVDFTCKTLVPS